MLHGQLPCNEYKIISSSMFKFPNYADWRFILSLCYECHVKSYKLIAWDENYM